MTSRPYAVQQDTIRQVGLVLCQIRKEPDGSFTVPYASEAAQALLGLAPDTVYPDLAALFAAVHPDDRTGLVSTLSDPALALSSWRGDVRLSGTQARWFSGYGVPQQAPDGATLWHIQFTDITALKLHDLALQVTTERLKLAVDSGSVGIWEYDVRSHALDWDDAMYLLYGARREDFSGAYDAWASRLHPDDRAATEAALQAAIEGRAEYEPDFRVVWPDGQVRYLKGHARVVRDAQGNALRMVGTNWDNSAYAEAAQALQFARAAIEKSDTAFFWTTSEGIIAYANDFACTNLGYAPKELIGWRLDALVPNLDRAAWSTQWSEASHSHSLPRRSQHRCKDGSLRQVEVTSHRIEVGGQIYVFSFVVDIGERIAAEAREAELESQLRESQKMEAIGTLAGGIAHDFNNALAAILGNLELARQDTLGNASAQVSLAEIHKAASRARELVQQILAFSRRQPSERTPLDLMSVVQESARLLRSSLPARLALQVHCAATVPPVLGNAGQLEQLILNLSNNAVQAMATGPGQLYLSLDTVLLDLALAEAQPPSRKLYEKSPGVTVRLSVTDTGCGMDAATLERVFEPFFTTKPVGEGTGLGLSVVHGIVRGHGGVITVQSQPGHGTTFTVYLPRVEEVAGLPTRTLDAAARVPLEGFSGVSHILYVDDDQMLLFLVKRLMERRGYRVSIYQDAEEALAALRADPQAFDLVLTDYNMPRLSGLDVAREIRSIRPDLRVAVTSGFLDEALRAQASEAGVSELIFKADNVEAFCASVEKLAAQQPLPG